jgi:hypothetical protein
MAEKRTNAEAAGVPAARTGEPESEQRSDPPRKRPVKAAASGKKAAQKTTKAAGKKAAPAVPVKPRRPTKAAKTAPPAEVAEPAKTAPAVKAAEPAKAAPAAKAAEAGAAKGKPTKAAPAARTAQPAKAVPVTAPAAASRVPGAVPGAWTEAAWAALREPDLPPRRLAELAVAELGPRAAAWAGWLRDTYRDPPAYGVARLATHQAGRLGTALASGAVAGPLVGPALRLLGMAWIRATVVLRIAAAYGHDPTDPRRVDDLIELLDLGHGLSGEPTRLPRWLGPLRLVPVGVELGRRPAAGLFVLLAAVGAHTEEIQRLAHRATRRYRTDETNESISSRNSR